MGLDYFGTRGAIDAFLRLGILALLIVVIAGGSGKKLIGDCGGCGWPEHFCQLAAA